MKIIGRCVFSDISLLLATCVISVRSLHSKLHFPVFENGVVYNVCHRVIVILNDSIRKVEKAMFAMLT